MDILKSNQYNQSIGKYKLLSSTAGVGSIITTRLGVYVLLSDMNKWPFIARAILILNEIRKDEADITKRYSKAKVKLAREGIVVVDDERFVEFLKKENDLNELICLVGIPNMALDERFNSPVWQNHPIKKIPGNEGRRAEEYMISGTHFPKWFINRSGALRTYSEWRRQWIKQDLGADKFVPPRDAGKPIMDSKGNPVIRTENTEGQGIIRYPLYEQLTQTNMVLICPNGHLSDVPWPKFLRWKTERGHNTQDKGDNLFTVEDCCSNPNLKWTENKTRSEGYGSIYLECTNCHKGEGKDDTLKINLEGINGLKPICPGHKPWEIDVSSQSEQVHLPYEYPCLDSESGQNVRAKMLLALVTGNNVYYANGFSSLYIPNDLAKNVDSNVLDAKHILDMKFQNRLSKNSLLTKVEFWETRMAKEIDDFIEDNGLDVEDVDTFSNLLKAEFIGLLTEDGNDSHEAYRLEEYKCFCKHTEVNRGSEGLVFRDIEIPQNLRPYFIKVQQVEELRITQVQLNFTRVRPSERLRVENKIITSTSGQNIYSSDKQDLFALPANQTSGEGLFFQFNDVNLSAWIEEHFELLDQRFHSFISEEPDLQSQGASIKQRIYNNGIKHFVIHTFSHLLMRELEFSCGYPTSSLKERLYIGEEMSGLLIYTAEGSEGSMGGLVWQGQPKNVLDLIIKAMQRAEDCSSDPLCWESEGQGIFDLNLAACFSCSLVSETACEEMNLGLDRRVLVDNEFGFLRELLVTRP